MPLELTRFLTAMGYGLAVAFVLFFAFLSAHQTLQKLSLILLAAWASTNLAFVAIGTNAFPLLFPTIEAGMAVLVASLGIANKSHIALGVFVLYGVMIVTHLVAIVGGFTDLYLYRATINASFIGQLLVVGVPSAWVAVAVSLPARGQRPRGLQARR